jgi:hypothetical protein
MKSYNIYINQPKGFMPNTIQTFTENTVEDILSHGGDYDWSLSESNAKACQYLVCSCSVGEKRGVGFLVGKISGIQVSLVKRLESGKDQIRYRICISEYAEIDLPKLWPGQQNPVRYTTLAELGIELSSLKFRPMPKPITQPEALTIAQAKAGLAKQFGVSEDSIEITIKG